MIWADRFNRAFQDYQGARYVEAEKAFREILAGRPDDMGITHILGVICHHLKKYDQAVVYLRRVVEADPANAEGFYNLANALYAGGHLQEALSSYESSLRLDPGRAMTHNNLGVALQACGRVDEAIDHYNRAIALQPDHAGAYNNLGNALREKGQQDAALRAYEEALHHAPGLAEAEKNLGNILRDKRLYEEARRHYSIARALRPDDADLDYNLGNLCREQGRLQEALEHYEGALRVDPDLVDAHYNLANTLRDVGRYDDAIHHYEAALMARPDHFETYNNMGVAYKEMGAVDRAIHCYGQALAIHAGVPETHWNKALALLLAGRFEEGWRGYEWRWKKQDYAVHARPFDRPLWDGSDIKGKTILLHSEQGYGDAIQFIRYVPLVANRQARVVVECQETLHALFKGIPGIDRLVVRGDELPPFDVHCPLLSLPLALKTTLGTIPADIPYLTVDPLRMDRWRGRIGQGPHRLKIGLAWAGNPEHKNDRNRSCSLEALASLLSFTGIDFFSLQKGEGGGLKRESAGGMKIIDHTDAIHDFTDTAALIQHLDLTISVDTAVAHLAGALGRPVWLLLPFAPDWRWLLHREDSPWYPTMRLFRQERPGDWGSVVRRIAQDLSVLLQGGLPS